MRQIRLLLAEDHLLMRAGVNALLTAEDDLTVVGQCGHYDDLMSLAARDQPDVVVSDIRMPPTFTNEGIRAAVSLRQLHPEMGVVVLSQFLDGSYLRALIADGSGGRAYLLKENVAAAGELVSAIRTVAAGGSFIDPLAVEALVRSGNSRSPLAGLTPRERDTLSHVAMGQSNSAIAAGFGVSERAIEKHINSIFMKLSLYEDRETNRRVRAVLMLLSDSPSPG